MEKVTENQTTNRTRRAVLSLQAKIGEDRLASWDYGSCVGKAIEAAICCVFELKTSALKGGEA